MNGNSGSTTRSVIEVFRGNPLVLALVLMNIGLLGFLYYGGIQAHNERVREMELLYENRKYVGDLLARCTFTPPVRPDG